MALQNESRNFGLPSSTKQDNSRSQTKIKERISPMFPSMEGHFLVITNIVSFIVYQHGSAEKKHGNLGLPSSTKLDNSKSRKLLTKRISPSVF